jgi:hypothetical protein
MNEEDEAFNEIERQAKQRSIRTQAEKSKVRAAIMTEEESIQ